MTDIAPAQNPSEPSRAGEKGLSDGRQQYMPASSAFADDPSHTEPPLHTAPGYDSRHSADDDFGDTKKDAGTTGRDTYQETGPGWGPETDPVPGTEPPSGAGEIERLRQQLREALQERDEHRDDLQRLQASFENYRKRVLADQDLSLIRQRHAVLGELLPVVDDLDRLTEDSDGTRAVRASVEAALARLRLNRIDQDDVLFDPLLHEAVAVRDLPADLPDSGAGDSSEEPPNSDRESRSAEDEPPPPSGRSPRVTAVLRCGWKQDGVVLRPALVEVER